MTDAPSTPSDTTPDRRSHMTAKILPYTGGPGPTPTTPDLTPVQQAADFTTWAPKLSSAAAIAREVSNTEFVPTALRGKPAAVTAAILAGHEIGIGPMASLNQVHIIEGRPALSAELIRALVLAHGHHIRYREMTTHRCVVEGQRRGEDDWTTVTWTMDDAKAAGLNGRQNWRKYPRRMLAARATGELGRLLFADVIAGMSYTIEELQDEADDTAPAGTEPKRTARRRTSRSKAKPATTTDTEPTEQAAPEPSPAASDDTATPPPLPGDDEDQAPDVLITPPQMRKLQALFTELALERDERLAISSAVVGRRLDTAKALTLHEAGVIIDTLERADGDVDKLRAVVGEFNDVTEQGDTNDEPPKQIAGDELKSLTPADYERLRAIGVDDKLRGDLAQMVTRHRTTPDSRQRTTRSLTDSERVQLLHLADKINTGDLQLVYGPDGEPRVEPPDGDD